MIISSQTVRNRAHKARMWARKAIRKPILLHRHKAARMGFSRLYERWNRRQWEDTLYTDECKFGLHRIDKRVLVWRRSGEEMDAACVLPRETMMGGSIMCWGGFSVRGGRTDLVEIPPPGGLTGVRYRDLIVRPQIVPAARAIGNNFMLLQDNAPCHTANVVRTYMDQNNIERFDWPAKSPDLNPIENLWDFLKRMVQKRITAQSRLADLRRILQEEWRRIPVPYLRKLAYSMRRRLRACIAVQGGSTKY